MESYTQKGCIDQGNLLVVKIIFNKQENFFEHHFLLLDGDTISVFLYSAIINFNIFVLEGIRKKFDKLLGNI